MKKKLLFFVLFILNNKPLHLDINIFFTLFYPDIK